VDAAVVDGESSLFQLAVDVDKAFAEADIAPCIILLTLHGGGDNGFDADNRSDKSGVGCFERFPSNAKERTAFVDGVPKGERGNGTPNSGCGKPPVVWGILATW